MANYVNLPEGKDLDASWYKSIIPSKCLVVVKLSDGPHKNAIWVCGNTVANTFIA